MTKTAAKTKRPAFTAPQTDEEADQLLRDYGNTFNHVVKLEADMNTELARVKARYELAARDAQSRLSAIFDGLSAWGAAHRDRLTNHEKSKTVQLPSGSIGWRLRPPSVRWKKGLKAEDIVEAIKALPRMGRFLRTKVEPDKEAMLKEPDAAREIDGVIIGSAGEEFFVAPFGSELSEPKAADQRKIP